MIAAGMAYAYAIGGKRVKALKIAEQFEDLAKERYVDGYEVAIVYSGLGDKDKAFHWLDRGIEEHSAAMVFLKVDPLFDRLHSDPRYADLLRRIGLPQ